jgi:hypothetical protein
VVPVARASAASNTRGDEEAYGGSTSAYEI